MIPVDQIKYSISRDHSAKAPSFKCVASLAQVSKNPEMPDEVVSAEVVAHHKDAARTGAQKALIVKLVGAAVKPAAAAPPPAAKPKE
jgi:hypothetical protein